MDYEDVLSGERLQALCDVSVGTVSNFAYHISLTSSVQRFDVTSEDISLLHSARTIFVYPHCLPQFFSKVFTRLSNPFVLVTHNSDDPVTSEYRTYLDDPKLLHWFGSNMFLAHPKATFVPCGLANSMWPHGEISTFVSAKRLPWEDRTDEPYFNFDTSTNPTVRTSIPGVGGTKKKSFADYLTDLGSRKYVVSPPGHGFDCHRTYEAWAMGCVPVVSDSYVWNFLPGNLPLIRVSCWETWVPEDCLKSGSTGLGVKEILTSPLTMSFWRSRLLNASNQSS